MDVGGVTYVQDASGNFVNPNNPSDILNMPG